MDEEPQVRGCYNITFICTATNQLEAWLKSHKSEVAITFICTATNQLEAWMKSHKSEVAIT